MVPGSVLSPTQIRMSLVVAFVVVVDAGAAELFGVVGNTPRSAQRMHCRVGRGTARPSHAVATPGRVVVSRVMA